MKRKNASLENDKQRMQDLFGYIRNRPPQEVDEIVKRIRNSTDISDVLRFIEEGDILQEQKLQDKCSDSRKSRIDADALRASRLKVPARPWTNVAGDGLVSNLVSSFLDAEQPYSCPMLDPEAFISDMTAADVAKARYCSPLLVNAMCAVGAVSGIVDGRKQNTVLTYKIGSLPPSTHWHSTLLAKASCRRSSSTKQGST